MKIACGDDLKFNPLILFDFEIKKSFFLFRLYGKMIKLAKINQIVD